MKAQEVRIGLVQLSADDIPQKNLEKTRSAIKKAAESGAQIVCLQELFLTKYFCDTENLEAFNFAEEIPGPTTSTLQQIAKEHNIVIIASLFEKRARGVYHNTAAVIDADGSYLGKYRKMHIPDDPGYYEKYYFTPGDLGYKVFNTKYAKVGVLICWDQWYPEAARITSMMGADILFYPTAIGRAANEPKAEQEEQLKAWTTIQQAHAIANGVHVVAVNRVGKEGDATFWGNSMVINPFGTINYKAKEDEVVHVETIDINLSEYYRKQWPFLRDRRIESYDPITKRYIDEDES